LNIHSYDGKGELKHIPRIIPVKFHYNQIKTIIMIIITIIIIIIINTNNNNDNNNNFNLECTCAHSIDVSCEVSLQLDKTI
jgi:hypothetical protein